MRIAEGDSASAEPFANLLPIFDALRSHGNQPVDGGFVLNPDGWRCRMARPIDADLIRQLFTLPPSIIVSSETDTVLDRLTWASIEGPSAPSGRDIRKLTDAALP